MWPFKRTSNKKVISSPLVWHNNPCPPFHNLRNYILYGTYKHILDRYCIRSLSYSDSAIGRFYILHAFKLNYDITFPNKYVVYFIPNRHIKNTILSHREDINIYVLGFGEDVVDGEEVYDFILDKLDRLKNFDSYGNILSAKEACQELYDEQINKMAIYIRFRLETNPKKRVKSNVFMIRWFGGV